MDSKKARRMRRGPSDAVWRGGNVAAPPAVG